MSVERMRGILLQEFYITKRSLEVIMDLFFTSVMTVIVFGFVFRFLAGALNVNTGSYLILGMLLWEVVRVNQYSLSTGSLWNIWARNLSNMFVAPLSMHEYLATHMLSGLLKTLIIFAAVCAIAAGWFHFNILRLGPLNLVLFFANLTLFSWSLGLVVLGVIFLVGTRIQALAWGLVFLFQPLTAAFYPVAVLPPAVQGIAYALPPTFVFEAARGALTGGGVNWGYAGLAAGENVVYFALAVQVFRLLCARSQNTGQFARNEG
jgi:ABC-2 type transport system permease protein